MSKPKHRRCATCGVVTSRYARTERQGSVFFAVWVRDARNGEQRDRGTGRLYCDAHAVPAEPVSLAPIPAMPAVTADDLRCMAALDPDVSDGVFVALSQAVRSVDSVNGEEAL
jgi:hypothetical protein